MVEPAHPVKITFVKQHLLWWHRQNYGQQEPNFASLSDYKNHEAQGHLKQGLAANIQFSRQFKADLYFSCTKQDLITTALPVIALDTVERDPRPICAKGKAARCIPVFNGKDYHTMAGQMGTQSRVDQPVNAYSVTSTPYYAQDKNKISVISLEPCIVRHTSRMSSFRVHG